jgi:hypothetical protein
VATSSRWSASRSIRVVNGVFVPLVFFIGVCAYVAVYANSLADRPIRSDGVSYYVYLPAIVLHHDPGMTALADDCCGGRFPDYTALSRVPGTRRWLDPHPIGVAVLMLPFFLAAHALTLWSNFTPDGFSFYYQHAAGLSGLAWLSLGLWWLQRHLARDCSPGVVLATMVSVVWGTNLFHYGTFDAGYSHAYSFAFVTALVAVVPRWFESPSLSRSALLGLIAGVIVLLRHANAIVLLYPVLYGLGVTETVAGRVRFAWTHRVAVAVVVACGLLTLAPQLWLYKWVSDAWLPNPYGLLDIGFDFAHPRLRDVLISPQKGLFFWSPLLLAAVAGFAVVRGKARAARWPALVLLAALTWVIASWGDWQFGGSYGHRGFTDVLAVFAVGLAAAYRYLAGRSLLIRVATGVVAGSLVLLSVFQMVQYWLGVVPFNDTTWDQYRALFLRLS